MQGRFFKCFLKHEPHWKMAYYSPPPPTPKIQLCVCIFFKWLHSHRVHMPRIQRFAFFLLLGFLTSYLDHTKWNGDGLYSQLHNWKHVMCTCEFFSNGIGKMGFQCANVDHELTCFANMDNAKRPPLYVLLPCFVNVARTSFGILITNFAFSWEQ